MKKLYRCKKFLVIVPTAVLFLAAALGVSSHSWAFNLNCGTDFVSEGASKLEVIKTCGEPIYKEVIGTVTRKVGNLIVEVLIEHWYYTEQWRASSTDLRLVFHGSDLVKIERADGRFD